jgi:hypothetical protein
MWGGRYRTTSETGATLSDVPMTITRSTRSRSCSTRRRLNSSGRFSPKKVISGFITPAFLEGSPDDDYFDLLMLALSRELSKRAKLDQWNTVDDAVELIRRSNNIIVLTGAGMSPYSIFRLRGDIFSFPRNETRDKDGGD